MARGRLFDKKSAFFRDCAPIYSRTYPGALRSTKGFLLQAWPSKMLLVSFCANLILEQQELQKHALATPRTTVFRT